MDIELFLILSTAYEEVRLPRVVENDTEIRRREYIKDGIETYMAKQGYTYHEDMHQWTAVVRGKKVRQTDGNNGKWTTCPFLLDVH